MTTVIKIENLSKAYQIGQIGTGTISRDVERWLFTKVLGREDPFLKLGETNDRNTKSESNVVWSLKDLNLEVERGSAVGIIGRNGAGKSTLLKLLSRVTSPTTGVIKIKGQVASLLEVGTGFHPELTGRENIYLNGSILGMRKHEIDQKLDEIIAFSGVERYVDTPVKRYSSGMTVRLAFAVAAHLESDILIVDEVLAVGDLEFQKKCMNKMEDVTTQGRTVLFVSHNMASIKELSRTAIVLKNGMIDYQGNVVQAIQHYSSDTLSVDFEENSETRSEGWFRIFADEKVGECQVLNTESFEITGELTLLQDIKRVDIHCLMESSEGVQVVHNRYFDFEKIGEGKHRIKAYIPPLYLKPGVYTLYFNLIGETDQGARKKFLSERLILDVSDNTNIWNGKVMAAILPPVEWQIDSV